MKKIAEILFNISIAYTQSSICLAAPTTLRVQGRLTDNSGAPIENPAVPVKFELFDVEIGGTAIFNQTQAVKTNEAGLFASELEAVPPNVFAQNNPLYLQISVRQFGDWKALSPRQELSSVPYAMRAEYATQAGSVGTLTADIVTSPNIKNGEIKLEDMAEGSIGSLQLTDGSVLASKLAASAVSSSTIKTGAITSLHLTTGAVRSDNIQDSGIAGADIAMNSIAEEHLQNGSVSSSTLKTDSVTSEKIKAGAVGENQLANGSVTALKIAPGAIGLNIEAKSIKFVHLATDAARSSTILDGGIDSADVAPNAIGNQHLQKNSVSSDTIRPDGVYSVNINDETIQDVDIASGSITSRALENNSIRAEDLAADTVPRDKINLQSFEADGVGLVPQGAIFMFLTACPAGFAEVIELRNRIPLGADTLGASAYVPNAPNISTGTLAHAHPHAHAVSIPNSFPGPTQDASVNPPPGEDTVFNRPKLIEGFGAAGSVYIRITGSDHTHDITPDTTTANVYPPSQTVLFCRKK